MLTYIVVYSASKHTLHRSAPARDQLVFTKLIREKEKNPKNPKEQNTYVGTTIISALLDDGAIEATRSWLRSEIY